MTTEDTPAARLLDRLRELSLQQTIKRALAEGSRIGREVERERCAGILEAFHYPELAAAVRADDHPTRLVRLPLRLRARLWVWRRVDRLFPTNTE